jgi:hypothetical protein
MEGGKMDQFDLVGLGGASGDDAGELLTCRQFTPADIPNYFAYAHNFTLGVNMFSSLHGASYFIDTADSYGPGVE